MIVTTANSVDGYLVVKQLGVVRGLVVRATSMAAGIVGGVKSIFGGNISDYERVCELARDDAYQRLIQHAQERGANAVIAMRYDATEFMDGTTEVLAYGTAVVLLPTNASSPPAVR